MTNILPLYIHEGNGTSSNIGSSVIQLDTINASSTEGTVYGSITLKSSSEKQENHGLLGRYFKLLDERPLKTKMVTVGTIGFSSDLVAQLLRGAAILNVDLYRSFTMFLIGVVLTAPLYHFLYQLLDEKFPLSKGYNRFIHLAADQLVAIPVWTVCFIILISLLEGIWTLDSIMDCIHSDFPTIVFSSWMVYPIVQYLNFTYVPNKLRILVLTLVGFLFTILISFVCSGTPEVENVAHIMIIPYT